MKAATRVALAVLLLVLVSCARTVRVDVENGLDDLWSDVVAHHPLPRGYRLRPEGGTVLRLARRGWTEPLGQGGFVLRTRAFAAVVPLSSPVEDVRLDELLSAEAPPVIPLEEVRLPIRAVSVDGMYPGDDGYPLVEKTVLSADPPDPGIMDWLQTLPRSGDSDSLCWVAAVGDVMMDRGVDDLLRTRGPQAVFRDTLPILSGADILVANFESASTHRTSRAKKAYTFNTAPEVLPILAQIGFDYLSLANNHAFDAGPGGFEDTLRSVRLNGIGTSGAGLNSMEAWEPYRTARGPSRVRIWSLAFYPRESSGFDGKATVAAEDRPGVLWADDRTVAALVQVLSSGDAIDIVMIHGGEEWSSVPSPRQRTLYRALAAGGAELVVGSHPHVLQAMEAHAGGLILYSLGNFVFPGMDGTAGGTDSVIALLGLAPHAVVAVRLVPVVLEGKTVVLDHSDAIPKRLRSLTDRLAQTPP